MIPLIRTEHVLEEVAATWDVSVAELVGRSLRAEHVWPRHLAMFLARFATKLSFSRIGARFGGRDHSTVLSAYSKIEQELATDVSLQAAVVALASRIRARADREAARYALSGELGHG